MAVVDKASATLDRDALLAGTLHGAPRRWLRHALLGVIGPLLPLRIFGMEHVPVDGPLLVASNHVSNADPVFLELVSPRPLFFMGKEELFHNPLFHWILDRFGGFPVARGAADRAALRHARSVLDNGLALGIFPEGGRSRSASLIEGHAGAGLIALQARAPVLPVAIHGTEFFPVNGEPPPRRTPSDDRGVTVTFGPPFSVPTTVDQRRVTSDEATRLIMTRVAQLLPEKYRGVYASEVELAGPRKPSRPMVTINRHLGY